MQEMGDTNPRTSPDADLVAGAGRRNAAVTPVSLSQARQAGLDFECKFRVLREVCDQVERCLRDSGSEL